MTLVRALVSFGAERHPLDVELDARAGRSALLAEGAREATTPSQRRRAEWKQPAGASLLARAVPDAHVLELGREACV